MSVMALRGPDNYAGVSGNVLINEDADRVSSYNVWNYAEGHDSYYASILVDLTQPPGEVRFMTVSFYCSPNVHIFSGFLHVCMILLL